MRGSERRRKALAELLEVEQTARREAEKASRLRDELLAMLSHQLRNPLNAIVGWAHLLRDGQLDAESTARGLDTICRNAELQGQLISDLLDASQLITDRLHFDAEPADMAALLKTVLDAVKPAADARELRVEAHLVHAAGAVAGDSKRLQKVLWSLLSNAVSSASRGGQLHVALGEAEGVVEVTIREIAGDSPDALAYLSNLPQTDKPTESGRPGWGLSFAIARYFVELHGGTIEASGPDGGLGPTLTLRLPRAGVKRLA